jgi:hypothetical protein
MPIPEGHYHELKHGRKFNQRERWLVPGAVVVILAIAIAATVAIVLDGQQHKSQHGCVDVRAATAIGGSDLYRCGAAARNLCLSRPGNGFEIAFRQALADACRKAGLPVPRVSSP